MAVAEQKVAIPSNALDPYAVVVVAYASREVSEGKSTWVDSRLPFALCSLPCVWGAADVGCIAFPIGLEVEISCAVPSSPAQNSNEV